MPKRWPRWRWRKRRVIYAVLVLIRLRLGWCGVGCRWGFRRSGLSMAGSGLWAMALYWLIAACVPRLSVVGLGCVAGVVAALVEFSRLWHVAAVDAFRLTLAGRLLLGRFFSREEYFGVLGGDCAGGGGGCVGGAAFRSEGRGSLGRRPFSGIRTCRVGAG